MNDESVPEEDRIYTKSKKTWCKKTTKEASNRLFELIEQSKIDIANRVGYPVPPLEEWIVKLFDGTYVYDTKV